MEVRANGLEGSLGKERYVHSSKGMMSSFIIVLFTVFFLLLALLLFAIIALLCHKVGSAEPLGRGV